MSNDNIKLSTLFEEVISDFIKRNPELLAKFEIENRFTVHGEYIVWRNAVEALVEYMVKLSAIAKFPSILFGRIGSESIYVVMDNGSQFRVSPGDTMLTITLHNQAPTEIAHIKRIIIKQGGTIWDMRDKNIEGKFRFCFN